MSRLKLTSSIRPVRPLPLERRLGPRTADGRAITPIPIVRVAAESELESRNELSKPDHVSLLSQAVVNDSRPGFSRGSAGRQMMGHSLF